MSISSRAIAASLVLACATAGAQAPPRAPLTAQDLVQLHRISDPRLAPDGSAVVYVQTQTDLQADRRWSRLWILDLKQRDAVPRPLAQGSANDTSPRWAP